MNVNVILPIMLGASIALLFLGIVGSTDYFYTLPILALVLLSLTSSLQLKKGVKSERIVYSLTFKSPPKKSEVKRDLELLSKVLTRLGIDYELTFKFKGKSLSILISVPRDLRVIEVLENKLPLLFEKLEFKSGIYYNKRSTFSPDTIKGLINTSNLQTFYSGELQVQSNGEAVTIGYTLSGEPVRIPVSSLTRHVSIFGATGSGKTTTAAILSTRLYEYRIPVLVLDWHNEYSHILKFLNLEVYTPGIEINPLKLNPLPPSSSVDDVLDTISVLEEALELTPSQAYYLEESVRKMLDLGYKVTLENVVKSLDYRFDDSYSGREARMALLRKLYLLTSGPTKYMFSQEENIPVFTSGRVYVVELGYIKSISLRRLYTLIMLKKIFQKYEGEGVTNNVRLIIVLDEAQNVLGISESNVASRMLSEVRKYGVGLVVITQSPSTISPQVLKNCGTKIIHSIRSNLDLKVIEESTSLGREEVKALPYLKRGEALVIFPEDPNPVLAKMYTNH